MINFESSSSRAEFIANNKSNIYTGTNVDGESVIIMLQQNEGMVVKTKHKSKPKWWECIEYDKDGWQTSVAYEPESN